MFIRKEYAGAASSGHEWPHDRAVVEVPDELGLELLGLSREFTDVAADMVCEDIEPADDAGMGTAEGGLPLPPRRGRPPKVLAAPTVF